MPSLRPFFVAAHLVFILTLMHIPTTEAVTTEADLESKYLGIRDSMLDGVMDDELMAARRFIASHEETLWGQRAAALVARYYAGVGEHYKALEFHRKIDAVRFYGQDALLLERAGIAEEAKDFDYAEATYRQLIKQHPRSSRAREGHWDLANMLIGVDPDKGYAEINKVIDTYPGSSEAFQGRITKLRREYHLGNVDGYVGEAISLLVNNPGLSSSSFSRLIGPLKELRRTGKWQPNASQSRALFGLQEKAYQKELDKRMLDIDAVYATALLKEEHQHWSTFYRAVGLNNAKRKPEAEKILLDLFEVSGLPATLNKAIAAELVESNFANDYEGVNEWATRYFKMSATGRDDSRVYRLWLWARRELRLPYEKEAMQMLARHPRNNRTEEVFMDLILDSIRDGKPEDGLRIVDNYLKRASNNTWQHDDQFKYWRARLLEIAGRKDEAKAALAKIDSYDTYGVMAKEGIARLGGKSTAYLVDKDEAAALVQAAKDYPDLHPYLQRWIATGLERSPETLTRRWKQWEKAGGWDRFHEATLQVIPDLINEEANRLLDTFKDDDAARFYIAMKAGEGGEQFRKANTLFRIARAAERRGKPIRSKLYWQEVFPLKFEELIRVNSEKFGLDRLLVHSLIQQESTYQMRVMSRVGAQGLMQLMPPTARAMTKRAGIPYDPERIFLPEKNIHLGTVYLQKLSEDFDGYVPAMLAGYNAGEGKAEEWLQRFGTEDPAAWAERLTFRETRGYVKRILRNYHFYHLLYGEGPMPSYLFRDKVVVETENNQDG